MATRTDRTCSCGQVFRSHAALLHHIRCNVPGGLNPDYNPETNPNRDRYAHHCANEPPELLAWSEIKPRTKGPPTT